MPYKSPEGQTNQNIIREAVIAFGDVQASFDTFIDLSTAYPNYIYTHLIIVNSLDENTKIKIGDNEITAMAGKDLWMDGLRYNGEIELEYVSAPSEGSIQIICY